MEELGKIKTFKVATEVDDAPRRAVMRSSALFH
jgi:hypothetical protein